MKVEGISKRGRQKIKLYGDDIEIIREGMVQFAPDIHILVRHKLTNSSRWIKKSGDIDFRIINGR